MGESLGWRCTFLSQYKAFKALTVGALTREESEWVQRGVWPKRAALGYSEIREENRLWQQGGREPKESCSPRKDPLKTQAAGSGLLCRVLLLVQEDGATAHFLGLAMRARRPRQERSGWRRFGARRQWKGTILTVSPDYSWEGLHMAVESRKLYSWKVLGVEVNQWVG